MVFTCPLSYLSFIIVINTELLLYTPTNKENKETKEINKTLSTYNGYDKYFLI